MNGLIAMGACVLAIVGISLLISHLFMPGAMATSGYIALAYTLNQRLVTQARLRKRS